MRFWFLVGCLFLAALIPAGKLSASGEFIELKQTRSRTTVTGEGSSEETARADAERKIQGQIGKKNSYQITNVRYSKPAGRYLCHLTVEYSRKSEKEPTYSRTTVTGEGSSEARARAEAENRIRGRIGKGKEFRIKNVRFSGSGSRHYCHLTVEYR